MKIRTSIAGKAVKCQSGFTYILVLVALVVVGILAGATAIPVSQEIKRDKEETLLFAGIAYRNAIQSYYQANNKAGQYPKRLEDLILDNRVLYKRHIRQLYPEPTTGEWQLLRNSEGGITGVVSPSQAEPLKRSGFPAGYEAFENAAHYSDWVFEYQPHRKRNENSDDDRTSSKLYRS